MKIIKLIISLIILITFSSGFSIPVDQKANPQKDSIPNQQLPDFNVKVIGVQSKTNDRQVNSALIGDYIAVKVEGLNSLFGDSIRFIKSNLPIFLVVNGSPCYDITYYDIDYQNQSIIFYLDSTSITLKKIEKYQLSRWEKSILSEISICYNNQIMKSDVKKFNLYFTSPGLILRGFFLFVFIILVLLGLAKGTNIMRLGEKGSPFSLAQSQLTFWTLVVLISVCYIWYITGTLPELTSSILALLGISGATTAGSKYVSSSLSKGKPVSLGSSDGFFRDILSDNNSTNIHRFQMVIWTGLLGFIFLIKVLTKQQLYEFNESYLILTGISSGSYVLLKFSENKDPQPPSESKEEKVSENNPVPALG